MSAEVFTSFLQITANRQQQRQRLAPKFLCAMLEHKHFRHQAWPRMIALPYARNTLMPLPSNDIAFNNWRKAAANAKDLLSQGHIDFDEYRNIMARARAEQGISTQGKVPMQQGQSSALAQPQQPARPESELIPMNGRALPIQSTSTWDQVKRFLKRLNPIRPAL